MVTLFLPVLLECWAETILIENQRATSQTHILKRASSVVEHVFLVNLYFFDHFCVLQNYYFEVFVKFQRRVICKSEKN